MPGPLGRELDERVADDDDDGQQPARPLRHLGVLEGQHDRVGDADVAVLARAVVDDVERDALEGEEERQRHHERRDAHLRPQEADQQADDHTGEQRGADGDRPRHVVADHQPHHHRGADTAGEAGGEVDLAEQQREHQAHREQDRAGALGEHVAEVVEAAEGRLDGREQDHQDDQSGGRRQRAHLAAAHPLHVEPEVVAGGVGRGRGRGDGGEVLVGARRPRPRPRPPAACSRRRGCVMPALLRGGPVVISSTSCCWLTSERAHLRGHLAEVEHRDAVGDLRAPRSCCARSARRPGRGRRGVVRG